MSMPGDSRRAAYQPRRIGFPSVGSGSEKYSGFRIRIVKKIYVGNLPYSVNDAEIRKMFESHGEVASASVVLDRDTGRPRGFGFVEMSNNDEADAAINAMNGQEMGGRALVVNEARPRENSGGGGGRGGYGGGGGGGGGGRRGGW